MLGERSATMSRTGWEAAPPLLPLRRAPVAAVQGRYASALHKRIFSYNISIPFITDSFGVIFILTYIILLRDGRRSCLLVPLRRAPLPTIQGRYAGALRERAFFSYSISIPLSSSWPARIAVGTSISIVIFSLGPTYLLRIFSRGPPSSYYRHV